MAKRQPKQVAKNSTKKKVKPGFSMMDHLRNISENKLDWDKYTESDLKAYSPYMINKWLSMSSSLVEIVNIFQPVSMQIDKREHYKLYSGILPKQKIYIRYVKGRKEVSYKPELLDWLTKYYELSKTEIIEYLDMFKHLGVYEEKVPEILKKYGIPDKKIQSLLKN